MKTLKVKMPAIEEISITNIPITIAAIDIGIDTNGFIAQALLVAREKADPAIKPKQLAAILKTTSF